MVKMAMVEARETLRGMLRDWEAATPEQRAEACAAAEAAAARAGEWERDENGLPLGYYVTVVNGQRVGWLLGPYRTHGEAEGEVDRGRELAMEADPFAHFYAFGTARAPERGTVFGV